VTEKAEIVEGTGLTPALHDKSHFGTKYSKYVVALILQFDPAPLADCSGILIATGQRTMY
jgi:hypothetical protein